MNDWRSETLAVISFSAAPSHFQLETLGIPFVLPVPSHWWCEFKRFQSSSQLKIRAYICLRIQRPWTTLEDLQKKARDAVSCRRACSASLSNTCPKWSHWEEGTLEWRVLQRRLFCLSSSIRWQCFCSLFSKSSTGPPLSSSSNSCMPLHDGW